MMRIASLLPILLCCTMVVAAEPDPAAAPGTEAGQGAATDAVEQQMSDHLAQAQELINKDRPARAIAEHLDPVIDHYKQAYADSGMRIFCAESPNEALAYMIIAAADDLEKKHPQQAAKVIGPNWAMASWLKGYALIEMQDIRGAEAVLQSAVDLSPQNPHYLSELAYVKQMQGRSSDALELYASAADWSKALPDEERRKAERSRACRGEGYVLVELQRWDDADKKYNECLAIDLADKRSAAELRYVRGNRPGQ